MHNSVCFQMHKAQPNMLDLFGNISRDRFPNGLMGQMWQRPDMLAMSAAVKPGMPFLPFAQPNPLFGKIFSGWSYYG